jgi:creatinine amidohydrolase
MIYADLTSPEIGRLAPTCIALLPIAAVEQHGAHLPVGTDTAIGTELARRAEAALRDQVLLLPTLWCGSSHHHFGFPGTISIGSETYIQVLVDLVESLARSGFRRIVLLNAHGGNIVPAAEALYRLNRQLEGPDEPWVAAATYWHLAADELGAQKFMETPALTHACEYETSMMLALRADWVRLGDAKGYEPVRETAFYDPLGHKRDKVTVKESFRQLTPSGALGKPQLATAAKGAALYDLVGAALVAFLQDFSQWKLPRTP